MTLAVIACEGDRQAARGASTALASRGPDQIVIRIPRAGGTARTYIYPRLDSAVSAIEGAPPIARALAFAPDDGTLAFIDDKGQPRRLDLRAGEARTASKAKLTSLSTVNGSDIFAVTPTGTVTRITPGGDWTFNPPQPARRVYPQENGSAIIAGVKGGKTELWLIRPTDDDILATASLPASAHNGTQVGDRIYFVVDSGLIGVRTKDLSPVKRIRFDKPVRSIVPTPSGDRMYVGLDGTRTLSVVDRYAESVSGKVELPGAPAELRMDPLGQNILVEPAAAGDSAWLVSVGTDKVSGTIRTAWRADLPAFAPANQVASVRGADVVFLDASSLAAGRTVKGAAADYWYFVGWNGFRPRSADLDQPVSFDKPDSQGIRDSASASVHDSIPSPPLRDATPTMLPPLSPPSVTQTTPKSYMVSFAAVLTEQKANETAATINVNGARPKVVAATTGSTTLFRVVLGPFATREEADKVGRESGRPYWVYEEGK